MSLRPIYIPYAGPVLLATSLLNKGTAFSESERQQFNLKGLIPQRFETIEQQAERAYQQYSSFIEPINKHIYLRTIQDNNETLFYYLLEHHLQEMMPIIYTPTVGDACERFSQIYRRARGLFISYPDRHHIDEILLNATKRNVKVVVVTDGSRILGLGDQGVGGMGIPIGKLSLYTVCGGISPAYTLPIMLDVGTDNTDLLNNPQYIGWQHPRIDAQQYDEFMDLFITAIKKRWPNVLLQFEDFEQRKALPLLNRYRDELCCFNDDIQGTAAVTVGSLLAACRAKQQTLSEQTIVFVGAGSAGCGIAEQVVAQMMTEGTSELVARQRIFMIDRPGLLTQSLPGLPEFQQKLAQLDLVCANWNISGINPNLAEVIENARPTVLIGVSGQAGIFTEAIIKSMYSHCQKPIIFPLSNPSKQIEAHPQQLIEWTDGNALIATGSPFMPVIYQQKLYPIAQCNNSYIFPGLGLAVVAAKIERITDEMLMVASEILASASPMATDGHQELLPPLTETAELSKKIAFAVAILAQRKQLAPEMSEASLMQAIEDNFWKPRYRDYQRVNV
ncbi:NAD-dependent malic enzyme [Methylophaga muralis]|uniref:malate dehydrogenase (oxaloacetate-decarboxylating) n=1 Tax=Methylophaga muralis TaxID=291169 RepID=A0A1E3GP39_9GAMM|nr:NAD-dependent malic enzyme [Methylophaga muralis]ODN65822.1 NAD-dependent malic enzyme [Methylophaga muralis]